MSSRSNGPFSWAQAIVGWASLAIILLSAIHLGANRPVSWTLLSIVIWLLFLLQVVLCFLRPAATALKRAVPWMILYGLVVGWGMVQVYWPAPADLAHPIWANAPNRAAARIGADPGHGAHIVMRLATYGMIAWIIAASTLNRDRAWQFVRAIALFSTALAAYGLYAALTGYNPVLGIDHGRVTPVSATFINRNSYATYAAFGLFANIVVYLRQAGRGVEGDSRSALRNFLENFFAGAWIYAFGVLLCGAAVALTASRAGGGATLLGLIVLFACLGGGERRRGPVLWGVLVFVIGFVAFALSSNLVDRLLASDEEQLRFIVYPALFEQLWDRPFLGQGIGAFQDAFRPHLPLEAAQAEWDMAHNSYLENAYELGLPAAALLYLVLFVVLLRLLRGTRVRAQDMALPTLALACLVTGGFHALFDFSLQMPACAALFAALLGLGWSQSFTRKDRAAVRSRDRNDI